jgi:hypothetical protein
VLQHPEAWLIPDTRNEQMNNVESVKKAFCKSRIAGEQNLSQGKITWDEFASEMLNFEAKLRSMGVVL